MLNGLNVKWQNFDHGQKWPKVGKGLEEDMVNHA